jgi:hypothetical protein
MRRAVASLVLIPLGVLLVGCSSSGGSSYQDGANAEHASNYSSYPNAQAACTVAASYLPSHDDLSQFMSGCESAWNSAKAPAAQAATPTTASGSAPASSAPGWSSQGTIDTTGGQLTSISCASTSMCVAVDTSGSPTATSDPGGGGTVFDYANEKWSTGPHLGVTSQLNAVSCPTTTFCAAVGDDTSVNQDGAVSTFNGNSWSAMQPLIPNDNKSGNLQSGQVVSCSSSTFCMAISSNSYAYVYNGTSWSEGQQIMPSDLEEFKGLSCPTTGFCVGLSSQNSTNTIVAFTYQNGQWANTGTLAPAPFVINAGSYDITCSTTTSCIAVVGGNAFTSSNGTWSTPDLVTAKGGLYGLSCPSAAFCMATGMDSTGSAASSTYAYANGNWSGGQVVDPNASVGAYSSDQLGPISCASPSFCIALASSTAYVYKQ